MAGPALRPPGAPGPNRAAPCRRTGFCATLQAEPLQFSRTARRSPQEAPLMSTSTWIVLGVIVALALWIIMIYNGLVAMRQRVGQAFADIDVQLKQRHDLIPNLVETVKGYAAHERGTLEAVVQARNVAMAAQGPAQQAAAENALSGA